MVVVDIPCIVGLDKIRVYRGNKVCAEQWIGGALVVVFRRGRNS